MSDLVSIGSSGIGAYQRALSTIANNIANVSTDGYSRQDISISANAPRLVGTNYLGTGSSFNGVRRQYDAFVEQNLRISNSELQSQTPLLSYVNRLIDVMGNESIGLTTAMNQFFESSRNLASDPASTVQRSIFLRDADGLAARFQQLDSQFELLDTETRESVITDIGKVNALTRQLAEVNRQLSKHATVDSQPSELLDQRDKLLRDLSSLTATNTRFEANGSVVVSAGDVISQGLLVQETRSREIGLSPASANDASKMQFVIDPYGTPEALPNILSGTIGGTLAFREQVLGPAVASLNNLAEIFAREVNKVHRTGIDSEGRVGTDLFRIAPNTRGAAGGMEVALTDVTRVAAAGQFRVIDDPLNTSNAQATIRWNDPGYTGPTTLAGTLAQGRVPQVSSDTFPVSASQPYVALGAVPLGMENLVLTLNTPVEGQTLQVMTRDGRHLAGAALSGDQWTQIKRTDNGMEPGATYEADTLGTKFLGMDLFLGARGGVQQLQQFDADTGKLLDPKPGPAMLQGSVVPSTLTGPIAEGTFKLNGVSLGALATTGTLTATGVVAWLNTQTAATGVTARVVATDKGDAIRLDRPAGNVKDDIRLAVGPNGKVTDLARLGFDYSLNINGEASDDLLVFVTSSAAMPATITASAQFTDDTGDMKQALRAQPLVVAFTSDSVYEIRDKATNTVLAERTYDPSKASIRYRGIELSMSSVPAKGDIFTIDGNRDGVGNNEALLDLAALEEARLMPSGLTMTAAYIERVNLVANMAQQASISQQALQVVYDQALEGRDGIAGVSLDEEAAALVRFQQAYQANAKVMQIASQLFETIIQVR